MIYVEKKNCIYYLVLVLYFMANHISRDNIFCNYKNNLVYKIIYISTNRYWCISDVNMAATMCVFV